MGTPCGCEAPSAVMAAAMTSPPMLSLRNDLRRYGHMLGVDPVGMLGWCAGMRSALIAAAVMAGPPMAERLALSRDTEPCCIASVDLPGQQPLFRAFVVRVFIIVDLDGRFALTGVTKPSHWLHPHSNVTVFLVGLFLPGLLFHTLDRVR